MDIFHKIFYTTGLTGKIMNRLIHNENNYLASAQSEFQTITLGGTTIVNRVEPDFAATRAAKCGFSLSLRNTRNNMDMEFSVDLSAAEGYMIFCGARILGNCSYPR